MNANASLVGWSVPGRPGCPAATHPGHCCHPRRLSGDRL